MTTHSHRRSSLAAGLALAATFLLGSLASGASWAQTRAALTKNVDEAGRTPYEYNMWFSSFGCISNCTAFTLNGTSILFDGPAVPAGKRLIVEWVSALLPSDGLNVGLALQSQQVIQQQVKVKWGYYGPFFSRLPGLVGMSSAAFTTIGPGEVPHVNIVTPGISGYEGFVTVSGYLIDATN